MRCEVSEPGWHNNPWDYMPDPTEVHFTIDRAYVWSWAKLLLRAAWRGEARVRLRAEGSCFRFVSTGDAER